MTKKKKEIIGTFFVLAENGEVKPIVVSQEIVMHYAKGHMSTGKFFNLENIDGPEVIRTQDPKVFKLANGEILRKTKEPSFR